MSETDGSFYVTGGTLRPDAPCYVERQADRDLLEGLLQGEFCYVLTSRQMGKSSLMVRTASKLRDQQVHVAVVDLTAVGQNVTPEQWYDGLLVRLGRQLRLEDELDHFWRLHARWGPVQRLFAAIRDVVLSQLPRQAVIFVDEIDTVRSLPFSTDEFFAAIRECYNRRAEDAEFNRLTFCLLGVASPTDLVRDIRLTPFNIGRRIELNDFSLDEVASLARGLQRHTASPSQPEAQNAEQLLRQVMHWTGGHPYLTQRLCQAVSAALDSPPASGSAASVAGPPTAPAPETVDRLCEDLFLSRRAQERDDNLLFVRDRLLRSEADVAEVLALYGRVLQHPRTVADDGTSPLVNVLRLSGIVRSRDGSLDLRNLIYARVFDRQWIRANMPDPKLRRAIDQARRAEEAAAVSHQRLVRFHAANGVRLMEQGDLLGALPWFAEALRLLEGDAAQEELHRFRLGTLLRHCPLLADAFFHDGPVYDAAFNRTGRLLVTASDDRTARVWDLSTGQPATPPLRHEGAVVCASFSPDGEWVLTASADGTARTWRVATGELLIATEPHERRLHSARFNLDGLRMVTASEDGSARLWDTRTGGPLAPALAHAGCVWDARFSPDGRRVLTVSSDHTARLWDADTGQPLTAPLRHDQRVHRGSFSPDGRYVATCGADRTVKVWDVSSGELHAPPMKHSAVVDDIEFSPEGGRLATASRDGTARVWDAHTGAPLLPLLQYDVLIARAVAEPRGRQLAFSPDGRRLVTASDDGTARVWDAWTGRPVAPPLRNSGNVLHAAFGPDAAHVITACENGSVRLWRLDSQPVRVLSLPHRAAVQHTAFSRDGRRVASASGDGIVRVWDAATGAALTDEWAHRGWVPQVEFSPSGDLLLSACQDGIARVWDAHTGFGFGAAPGAGRTAGVLHQLKELPRLPFAGPLEHPGPVERATFSTDGRRIITASGVTALVWDAAGGRLLATFRHDEDLTDVACSPDGASVVTGSWDGTVRLWIVGASEPRLVLPRHPGPVTQVAFSPDGRHVLTACGAPLRRSAAQLWDAGTGQALSPPLHHQDRLSTACFSPDGRRVLTASWDRTARVWKAPSGEAVTPPLKHRSRVTHAAFSPDGRRIVTTSEDGLAWVWDAATGQPITPPLSHGAAVGHASFDAAGGCIVTACADQFARLWHLSPERRPSEDLAAFASLLSAHRIDHTGGLIPVDEADIRKTLEALRARYPRDFSFDAEQRQMWHEGEAVQAERSRGWFAAHYHLMQLLELQPANRELRVRLTEAQDNLTGPSGVATVADTISPTVRRASDLPSWSLDLTPHFNARLTETWLAGLPENHLTALAHGRQTLAGVAFNVRGVIQLGGRAAATDRFPAQVTGIAAQVRCRALHFLHACAGSTGTRPERPVASYLVHYADGTLCEIRVVYGRDVAPWWAFPEDRLRLSRAVVAWTGTNPAADSAGALLRLFRCTWHNPHPQLEVQGIDLVSHGALSAPFVLAITAEP